MDFFPDVVRISALDTVAGYGIFAAKDLKAGELIFKLGRPLVAELDNMFLEEACSWCFRFNTADYDGNVTAGTTEIMEVKACSGCKKIRYCSKQCQTASWKRHHKHECKLMQKLTAEGMGTPLAIVRAVMQLLQGNCALTRMDAHLDDIAKVGGRRYRRLQALSLGVLDYSGTKLGLKYIQHCFAMVRGMFQNRRAVLTFDQMQTNSFTLTSPTFDPLGVVMDPHVAKFNHSCDPSAYVVFDGSQMSLRCLKPIAVDEEIFVSYIDTTNPYFRRQSELQTRYFFTCTCSKCKLGPTQKEDKFAKALKFLPADWDKDIKRKPGSLDLYPLDDPDDSTNFIGIDTASAILEAQQWLAFHNLEQAGKVANLSQSTDAAGQAGSALKLLKEGLQACLQTKIWPDHRQPLPALRQQVFVELLTPGFDGLSWSFAFRQGLKLYFDIHPILYPLTFHPGRIIHKWTLMNLALMLADSQIQLPVDFEKIDFGVVIIGLLIEVQDNVKQSHGSESRFAGIVRRKFEEVTVDMTRGDDTQLQKIRNRIESQWRLLRQIARSKDLDSWMTSLSDDDSHNQANQPI